MLHTEAANILTASFVHVFQAFNTRLEDAKESGAKPILPPRVALRSETSLTVPARNHRGHHVMNASRHYRELSEGIVTGT